MKTTEERVEELYQGLANNEILLARHRGQTAYIEEQNQLIKQEIAKILATICTQNSTKK